MEEMSRRKKLDEVCAAAQMREPERSIDRTG
jgi:hypothetical protein